MKLKAKSKFSSLIIISGITAVLLFLIAGFVLFGPNISTQDGKKMYLKIPDNSTFQNVLDSLNATVKVTSDFTFRQTAKLLGYGKKIRPGRYELTNGMSNFNLIRKLRSGLQTPVKLTFNNIRTKQQLAKRLSTLLMADSLSIVNLLNDNTFLSAYGFNSYNSVSVFIPDTYEIFWDCDASEIFARMLKEYNRFWTEERKVKAAQIPLTLTEVSALASIVEEESNVQKERPAIAGLYINRLRQNMPLQADPTVKFACGDFSLRRVAGEVLKTKSPYNTYMNTGLPPGPIRICSSAAIDAVLDYENHDYIYMCAKETFNGEHNFAKTWPEHVLNGIKYRKALDERKIFK